MNFADAKIIRYLILALLFGLFLTMFFSVKEGFQALENMVSNNMNTATNLVEAAQNGDVKKVTAIVSSAMTPTSI